MSTFITPVEPLDPEEFEEAREQAEESEHEHAIEQFETAEAYNTYVAAGKATGAVDDVYNVERKLSRYEDLAKGAGLALLVVLAAEGLQKVLRGY